MNRNQRSRFVKKAYRVDAQDKRRAVDVIVDKFDDLQLEGKFDVADALLLDFDPYRLSESSIVSVLGITLAAKGKLQCREAFYRRSRCAVAAQRMSEEAADKLLTKYK